MWGSHMDTHTQSAQLVVPFVMSSSDRYDPVVANMDRIFEPSFPFTFRFDGVVPSCSSSMSSKGSGADKPIAGPVATGEGTGT